MYIRQKSTKLSYSVFAYGFVFTIIYGDLMKGFSDFVKMTVTVVYSHDQDPGRVEVHKSYKI